MKVVISRCFGGFGLSEEAIYAYAKRKGLTLYPEPGKLHDGTETDILPPTYWTVPLEKRSPFLEGKAWENASMEERHESNRAYENSVIYDHDIPRNDSDLIATVESLGSEKASGRFAELEIVEIPDGTDWEVQEYDGNEWIAEKHRTW